MAVIGTEVLAVDSVGALYRAIVRIGFPRYRGSLLTLKFGENIPFTGFTQNGQLDLVYHEDPLLRAGRAVSALGDSVTLTNFAKDTDKMQETIAASTARLLEQTGMRLKPGGPKLGKGLKATELWPAILNY